MPKGPAARIMDPVMHPLPPVLLPGPGSPTVLFGKLPARRGVGGAAAASIQCVVVDGSTTVFINKLPACRVGDTIVEAIGPPNKIAMGCPTVIIGG